MKSLNKKITGEEKYEIKKRMFADADVKNEQKNVQQSDIVDYEIRIKNAKKVYKTNHLDLFGT